MGTILSTPTRVYFWLDYIIQGPQNPPWRSVPHATLEKSNELGRLALGLM